MTDDTITRGDDPAYRDALMEQLGDVDPIHELSQLFVRLPGTLEGLSEDDLTKPEREGKWSVLEVVRHLADVELVQGNRIRRILVEDRPTLDAMDPDRWMQAAWSPEATLQDALEQLRALRVANLHLVASLPPEAMDRVGTHAERGDETLGTVLRLIAAHDGVHLRQIVRIRSAIGAAGVAPEPAGEGA